MATPAGRRPNAGFGRSSFGGVSSSANDVLSSTSGTGAGPVGGSTVTGAAPGQSNYEEEKGVCALDGCRLLGTFDRLQKANALYCVHTMGECMRACAL